MSSIACGNCHNTHASVAEVKACYGNVKGTTATVSTMTATKPVVKVPESYYALENLPGHSNALTFFQVKNGKQGSKWEGFQFVTRLVGAPGEFREFPVKGDAKAIVLRTIADDPKAAAVRFSTEFTICAACGATLTDDDSRARGLGPVCAAKF